MSAHLDTMADGTKQERTRITAREGLYSNVFSCSSGFTEALVRRLLARDGLFQVSEGLYSCRVAVSESILGKWTAFLGRQLYLEE